MPLGFSNYSRFVAPWIEEFIKGLAVVGLFWFNRIGYKLDAVISGFAIGAGFSVVENILYLTRYPELAANVWMVRGLGTAVMHGTTCAVLAATAHEFAERETRGAAAEFDFNLLWFVPGLLVAVAHPYRLQPIPRQAAAGDDRHPRRRAVRHHGDLPLRRRRGPAMAVRGARGDTRRARPPGKPASSPTTKAAARSRRWWRARTTIWRRRIREYCQLLTWLLLQAEDTLHDQVEDTEKLHIEGKSAFERLDRLRRDLGKSNVAALKAMLPFSRNDYWEISELEERLGR